MKFQMHLSLTATVEAKDEADALKQLASVAIGDTTRQSTQIIPMPEQEHAH